MFNKGVISTFSFMLVVAAVALMGILPMHQAWQINAWSLQYTHQTFSPAAKLFVLAAPPVEHARASLWLASDALKSGNPALAEKLIVLQFARGNQFAMHLMAESLWMQGDFAGAVAIWQQARDVDRLLWAASKAQQAGRLDEALNTYKTAWTLDPESGTLPIVNFLLDTNEDYGTAENELRQSLATYPNSRNWLLWAYRLSDVLRAQKRWDEAAAALESTIVRFQDNWPAHLGLGWVSYERGDRLQAMSEFQKVINAPESLGNGQYAIAQVLVRERQLQEADVWFVQALALNPEAQWWYVERGNAACQAGNLTLALAVYREALVRFPDFAQAYYEIAYVYQLNDQPAQSVAAIERALALMAPPEAYYYIRAGSIYEWAEDKKWALHEYFQALLIDPQNVAALEGVQRLNK